MAATITLDNPKHIEAIYDSDRRRQFQDLVRRYMNQLLYGCNREGTCTVPTCWTARKRLSGNSKTGSVGRGRRLTVLSARIIACHLASREHPYEGLCEGRPVMVGLAVDSRKKPMDLYTGKGKGRLKFSEPWSADGDPWSIGMGLGKENVGAQPSRPRNSEVAVLRNAATSKTLEDKRDKDQLAPKYQKAAIDQGAKDPRSFTQMLYDTKPFRMLEWLALPPPLSAFRLSASFGSRIQAPVKVDDADDTSSTKSESTIDSKSEKEITKPPDPLSDDGLSSDTQGDTSQAAPFTPVRSPSPPTPPAVPRRRDVLYEAVTPTSHTDTRGATSFDPQTPVGPPHVPQIHRPNRREKPVFEIPQTHYHQSQFTEHFYGLPPLQQTPSKAPTGSAARQLDLHLPFGALMSSHPPSPDSPMHVPTSLEESLAIPPPQSLSHLNILLVLSLVNICINRDTLSSKNTGAEIFARQSVFYCLSSPEALMKSFLAKREKNANVDLLQLEPMSTDKAFRIMNRKWESSVMKGLWKGLEELYKYKTVPSAERSRQSTPVPHIGDSSKTVLNNITQTLVAKTVGSRQHLLDDHIAMRLLVISMHALAAMLPREGTLLPRPPAREEDWLAMRMLRGRGLITIDVGDCFENQLAERLMRRVVKVLDYRIEQAQQRLKPGEKNPVINYLQAYLRSCSQVELETLKGENGGVDDFVLGPKKVKFAKYWSFGGCMVEWARTVVLKSWTGKEEVAKGSITAAGLRFLQIICELFLAISDRLKTLLINTIDECHNDLRLEEEIFATPLFADRFDPKETPVEWFKAPPTDPADPDSPLHLLSYPFLFPPSTLVTYFRAINMHLMTTAYETALDALSLHTQVSLNHLFPTTSTIRDQFIKEKLKTACTTYLLLGIRREHLLEDAFNGVYKRELRELLKPLKVKFLDSFEEGVDQGGPQYEFFNVLLKEVMEPKFGMFVDTDTVNHVSWFRIDPLEKLHKFELLGILMGIAVYNGITLPVNFPMVFYMKLLGLEATSLDDLVDGWPELVKGLKELLKWDQGDVEDVFLRTYEFSYEKLIGGQGSVDMYRAKKLRWAVLADADKTDGAEYEEPPMVTNANRQQYVADYISWLTDRSIRPYFDALRKGFFTIIRFHSLALLSTPNRLKLLIEGTQTIDVNLLQSITKYDDGYSPTHLVIREFWDMVSMYGEEEKAALLEFVTASDRVPVNGLESVTFVIQRNGGDSEMLPTSMTCFGRLLLPEYKGKGKLREKVKRALENSRGFGII